MIGYNPSHLNKNETLLEAFHRVEAYLIEHPLYQLYQTTDNYVVDKFDYSLGNIVLPDYGEVSAGDVVLFNNVYYAVVLSVDKVKQTFNIDEGIDFRGPQGPQGPLGPQGPQGPQGPKGDSGVGNAKLSNTPGTSDTDGYTQKAVNGIVQNPNLLINPNFAINQRGQASYTGTNYTVDRWKLAGGGSLMTTSKGIQITSTNSWQGINQYIEDYKQLNGQTITLSFKVSTPASTTSKIFAMGLRDNDGEIKVVYNSATEVAKIYSITITIPAKDNRTQLFVFLWSRYADEVFDIEWAKLEIGSVATEFSPPNIAEELPKCQRYYEVIKNNGYSGRGYAIGGIKAANEARFYIEFKQTKRSLPTITYGDASDFIIFNFASAINCTSIATIAANENGVMLRANGDSLGTIGSACQLNSDGTKNAEIKIDAEI